MRFLSFFHLIQSCIANQSHSYLEFFITPRMWRRRAVRDCVHHLLINWFSNSMYVFNCVQFTATEPYRSRLLFIRITNGTTVQPVHCVYIEKKPHEGSLSSRDVYRFFAKITNARRMTMFICACVLLWFGIRQFVARFQCHCHIRLMLQSATRRVKNKLVFFPNKINLIFPL